MKSGSDVNPLAMVAIIVAVAVAVALMAGPPGGEPAPVPVKRAVTMPGTYPLEATQFTLVVRRGDKGMLDYRVVDAGGKVLLGSEGEASIFRRWFLYWDEDKRLWAWSSETGGALWSPDAAGIYQRGPLPATADQYPPAVLGLLPPKARQGMRPTPQ